MTNFVLFHWILIQIFIAHTASQTVVRAVTGQPVKLPCDYQVTRRTGISDVCWGRGSCPNSKCKNTILETHGSTVRSRKSRRYDLQGSISTGDVSLTIGTVEAGDAGVYCCRVEIPGLFNDIKKNIRLEVARVTMVTTSAPLDSSAISHEDDMFCVTEPGPLPGSTEVTTEFPNILLTEEGSTSADTSVMMEKVPNAGISANSDVKAEQHDDSGDKWIEPKPVSIPSGLDTSEKTHPPDTPFPSSVILIACVTAGAILFVLMFSLFWKRKHVKKLIIKSVGPPEEREKVFSGAEGENSIFSL
ncbi:T-cell immunoglobulin and mucin domain-containing protein 4-like isoform X3 [Pipra filicauda]|uniref:T-cell immunoglobulin and mucin domain-containing protein 4-like isoform X3 n=1 Tax=Pipra filicauda TaxID=649802 RepID=UPI00193A3825|nr:T-cell immunoglobulin and mucin domain-containing protein 4-like isoform X3 [Pipra filicauda]